MNIFNKQNEKKLLEFARWCVDQGCICESLTSDWEVLRINAHGKKLILYKNAKDVLNWPFELLQAYKAFCRNDTYKGFVQKFSERRSSATLRKRILQRDGTKCFYCGEEMGDDVTLEHILAIKHGGVNRIENLACCHEQCNKDVGHLSISQKIKYRDKRMLNKA